jgi:hypothetical protein
MGCTASRQDEAAGELDQRALTFESIDLPQRAPTTPPAVPPTAAARRAAAAGQPTAPTRAGNVVHQHRQREGPTQLGVATAETCPRLDARRHAVHAMLQRCAAAAAVGRDACSGDSGDPALSQSLFSTESTVAGYGGLMANPLAPGGGGGGGGDADAASRHGSATGSYLTSTVLLEHLQRSSFVASRASGDAADRGGDPVSDWVLRHSADAIPDSVDEAY